MTDTLPGGVPPGVRPTAVGPYAGTRRSPGAGAAPWRTRAGTRVATIRSMTNSLRPIDRLNPRRVPAVITIAGLIATAVGDGAPEGLDWDGPGPAIFAVLAALVAVVRGRSMLLLAVVLSATFLYGSFANPESVARLTDPWSVPDLGCAILQVVGLVCAVVAGVVALRPPRDRALAGA